MRAEVRRKELLERKLKGEVEDEEVEGEMGKEEAKIDETEDAGGLQSWERRACVCVCLGWGWGAGEGPGSGLVLLQESDKQGAAARCTRVRNWYWQLHHAPPAARVRREHDPPSLLGQRPTPHASSPPPPPLPRLCQG